MQHIPERQGAVMGHADKIGEGKGRSERAWSFFSLFLPFLGATLLIFVFTAYQHCREVPEKPAGSERTAVGEMERSRFMLVPCSGAKWMIAPFLFLVAYAAAGCWLLAGSRVRCRRDREALREAMKGAEAASRAKDRFLATMSHELRTPMNGVVGMLDLLAETPLTEQQRDYLAIARESSATMIRVLNGIIDFSKIEKGLLALEREPFSLREAVESTVSHLRAKAERKGVRLVLEPSAVGPDRLIGDVACVARIVACLVGNAVKFTEKGEITVTARARREGEGEALVTIAVRDTGIGIPPELLGEIFEPFTQADDSLTRKYGGMGIGLSLAREMARAMGGDVTVESGPGPGSTFTCAVRTAVDVAPLPEEPEGGAALPVPREPSRLRVLLAEDDPENREAMILLLGKDGHVVVEAANGRQALDLLERSRFDLVLMDVEMPLVDGLEAARAIRARERETGGRLPVVALTAHAVERARELCLAAGMDGYLLKPIDVARLREVLARYAPAGDPPSERFDGGDGGTEEVASWNNAAPFMEQAPLLLAELREAVARGNPELTEKAARRLKELAILAGAVRVVDEVFRMQLALRRGDTERLSGLIDSLGGAIAGLAPPSMDGGSRNQGNR